MRFALVLFTLSLFAFGAEAQSSANGPTPPAMSATVPDATAQTTTPTSKPNSAHNRHSRHHVHHAARRTTTPS